MSEEEQQSKLPAGAHWFVSDSEPQTDWFRIEKQGLRIRQMGVSGSTFQAWLPWVTFQQICEAVKKEQPNVLPEKQPPQIEFNDAWWLLHGGPAVSKIEKQLKVIMDQAGGTIDILTALDYVRGIIEDRQ